MDEMQNDIYENIKEVRGRIAAAAHRVGRDPDDILLLAVSKTIDVPRIQQAVDCGAKELGENKVQEILDKFDKFNDDIKWHLIGHLQTNKVKYIVDKVALIHSVDSLKLAEEISKRSVQNGIISNILIEINVADETSKFGVRPENAEGIITEISKFPNLCIKGLMTVAPFVENSEENRKYFKHMKQLLVDINAKKINNVSMDVLSMGMTGDYETAVEEGATIVRVGTGVFGARVYNNK